MEVEATSQIEVSDLGFPLINQSGLSDTLVTDDSDIREIATQLSRWVDNARAASGRTTMFDRGKYTPPNNVYDEIRSARVALDHDDIVSGVAEITESFAFGGVKWESSNADDADIFNQMARDLNFDELLRKQWREAYACSTYIIATRWGWKTYKVRGKTTGGNKRKKEYRVWCPVEMRLVDPAKVVPVNHSPFGDDLLAWCSTNGETAMYRRAFKGEVIDPLMTSFYVGTYEPDQAEARELTDLGVDVNNLLVLNPELVWRFTLTKSDYERFASVRLKSVFSLLDLKQQLIHSDRAMLIGAANYILLIRKGERDAPATPDEMQNLRENYNFIAKLPVIIADHRLQVDIVAPKTDFVLQQERYDVLDTRILARLLGTLSLGGSGQRNETNVTLSHAVAKAMENRRHMMARKLEEKVAAAVCDHPRNADVFETEPNLVFTPRNISLDISAAMIQALVGLRSSREMSRETILEYFGLDQTTEALRMEIEAERFDDIFKTQVPYSAAPNGAEVGPNGAPSPPQDTGRRGGRPAGGGTSPDNPTRPKPQTPSGNPSTGGS